MVASVLNDSVESSIQVVRLHRRGATWHVQHNWSETLLADSGPQWFSLQADEQTLPIKPGHHRMTWRVTIDHRCVIAKVIEIPGLLGRLASSLIGTPAEREWRTLRAASRRGIPVTEALAVGVRRSRCSQTVLILKDVRGALTLHEAWAGPANKHEPISRPDATRLISATAALLACAHEHGLVHGDTHAGNILVYNKSPDKIQAMLIDLQSARLQRRPLGSRAALGALAELDQHFRRHATRTQRLRFVKQYLNDRPALSTIPKDAKALRATLLAYARVTARHTARLARRRDRRLKQQGRYFATIRMGNGWKATVTLKLERRQLFPEPGIPDGTIAGWRTILKPVIERYGSHRPLDQQMLEPLVLEHHRYTGLFARISATLGRTTHRKQFESAHRRRHRDLKAELILGVLEHRHRGLVDATILVRPANPDTQQPSCARRSGNTSLAPSQLK